ncbi:hypothetical protein [Streptomyces cacaoi]|uniref:hypothetical protein n=1 Tax=Streptomyces cacaoi TaxID=1898 RepID=UPI00374A4FE5
MPHGRSARKRGECPRRSAELAEHVALAELAELAVFAEHAALAELLGLAELAELAALAGPARKHGMCPECPGYRQPPGARRPFTSSGCAADAKGPDPARRSGPDRA